MNIMLSLSIAILAGLLMTRVLKIFKLPAVTAYLIAGILVGPYVLGRLNIEGLGFLTMSEVEQLSIVSDVALGFIAFSIGNEFRLKELETIGKQAFVVGVVQALVAALFIDCALILLALIKPDMITIAQAITLGAIGTATAPAATLMVVKQYKAKGKLVDLLLPIVALDDAVGLVVFAVSFGIAKALVLNNFDLVSIIVNPLLEIVLSLVLGALLGYVLNALEKLFNSNHNRLNITVALVFLCVALSQLEFQIGSIIISFSSLLVCMMAGTVFCNLCPLSDDIMEKIDRWTNPLFALFFVISGSELELNVFSSFAVVLIGIIYILTRSLGKYFGAYFSAKATGCDKEVYDNLGICLLPQAGVALGMCVEATVLGEQGTLIRNITLAAILIYELIGPLLTKRALERAHNITEMPEEVKNRRQHKLSLLNIVPFFTKKAN
jgi:Kef-type K+ transport system membrane component KefB